MNLLLLVIILTTLEKLFVILKLRVRNISKRKDDKSHIFKHLQSNATCFDSYDSVSFKIINKANSKFNLQIKWDFHIKLKRTTTFFSCHSFTIAYVTPLFLSFFVFLVFLFHLLFSLSVTLIIDIFYCWQLL